MTIGNFDGVHRGHRALVDRARELAGDGPVCAYTFHPAPRDVLRPGNGVPRIQSLPARLRSLGAAGADHVVVEPFTRELGALPPRAFAELVLRDRLRAKAVVVGWDFRFGRGRAGDAAMLQELLDVPVSALDPVQHDGAPISSSRVRDALRAGDVAAAAELLGHPHALLGRVAPGDRRGRELGFPTANVAPDGGMVPADGVYAVRMTFGAQVRPGVANIGTRPTFDTGVRAVEVHLLDFDGDLYGADVAVELVARLRGERRFPDRDALVAQIREDVVAARRALGLPG